MFDDGTVGDAGVVDQHIAAVPIPYRLIDDGDTLVMVGDIEGAQPYTVGLENAFGGKSRQGHGSCRENEAVLLQGEQQP